MKLLKFVNQEDGRCEVLKRSLKSANFEVVEIDVEQNKEEALKYGVEEVPTLVLLDNNNKVVETVVGVRSANYFKKKIEQHKKGA